MLTYNKSERILTIRGSIILKDRTEVVLTPSEIIRYSFSSYLGGVGMPLGTAEATSYTLEISNVGHIYTPAQFDDAEVYMQVGIWNGSEYVFDDFGVWYVDNASAPEQSVSITLTGMDALGTRFAGLYIDSADYPMSIERLALAACVGAGVALKNKDFGNSSILIEKRPEWAENTTLRDIISYCAVCAGGFARIARNGKLEIVSYADGAQHELSSDLYHSYSMEGGEVFRFNSIEAMLSTDAEDYTRFAIDPSIEDNPTNTIQVEYNPLLTANIINSIVGSMRGIEIESGSVTWGGDPKVMPGDYYVITQLNGNSSKIMVMNQEFSFGGGLSVTERCELPSLNSVSSASYSTAPSVFDSNGNVRVEHISGLDKKIIAATIGHFDKVIAENITTDALLAKVIEALNITTGTLNADVITALKITAEMIEAGFITADMIASNAVTTDKLDAKAVTADKIDSGAVTAEKIESGTITADRIASGTITAESGIIAEAAITAAMIASINADVITAGTLSAERLLLVGDDGLIYRINASSGGLTAQQLQQEEYKKYLDGSVIVAQSITAAQIAAETIKAINLDVSEIFANEATIAALNAWDIRGSKYLNLYVPPKAGSVESGTSVLIDENQFRVTTPEAVFVILSENSPDGDELLSIDGDGVSGKMASFDVLHSPTVIPAVEATHYTAANGGELEAIVSGMNNTYLKGDITIDASAVTSASITLRGMMGGGRLNIIGGTVNSISVSDCAGTVQLTGVSLSAAGTAVKADRACLTITRCSFNAGTGLALTDGADVILDSCTGVCTTLAKVARGAILFVAGDNLPYGLVEITGGDVYSPYPFEAAPSYDEPDMEVITDISLTAVRSRTWDNGWLSASTYGSAIYQGAVGGALRRGCMWFDVSAIRGREILSATLSVRRMTGVGGGGAVTVGVYGTTTASDSGTPVLGAKYASASIAREETKVIDVTQAVQHLADGDIAGLVLYDTNTKTFNGKSYTYNYAKFYGAGTAYAPVLTVRMKGVTA